MYNNFYGDFMEFLKTVNLFDLKYTEAKSLLLKYEYPFEVLPHIGEFISEFAESLDKNLYREIEKGVFVAKTARIAPSASIAGPCIIGENTEIRHCAYIRGNVFIGKNCVVGNSTEVKNSIIFDRVEIPHYNYVGDSVLGYRAHLGAGAVISNIKSDRTPVKIKAGEKPLETGLIKVGAFLGDFAEIGCGSVLNPGTVVGRHTNVYPLSFVRGYIPENSIYKKQGEVTEKTYGY